MTHLSWKFILTGDLGNQGFLFFFTNFETGFYNASWEDRLNKKVCTQYNHQVKPPLTLFIKTLFLLL